MMRLLLTFLFFYTLLTGCTMSPGLSYSVDDFVTSADSQKEKFLLNLIPITPSLIEKQTKEKKLNLYDNVKVNVNPSFDYDYKVGSKDILSIIVWDHPELTIPRGGQRPAEEVGHRVSSKGTIFYPYVGLVKVAGKTTEQIRIDLTKHLSKYVRDPQLDVRVVGFYNQKIQVAGAVDKPGSYPITDIALTLSDVVNSAGVNNEKADIQSILLTRNGVRTKHNLIERYFSGDTTEDVLLINKDVIYVPTNSIHKVFVMGEVKKQSALPLIDGQLTLADALATSGVNQLTADNERIFVLRKGDDFSKPNAFHLDASNPGALILATSFQLKPLDIVFVSTTNAVRWSRSLSLIMPSVNAIWFLDSIAK